MSCWWAAARQDLTRHVRKRRMHLPQVLWVGWTTSVVVFMMLGVADAGAPPHYTHLAAPPHTTSTLGLLTKALTKEEEVEEAPLLEEEVEEGALLEDEVEEGALLEEEVEEGPLLEEEVEEGPLLEEEVEEAPLLEEEEMEAPLLEEEVEEAPLLEEEEMEAPLLEEEVEEAPLLEEEEMEAPLLEEEVEEAPLLEVVLVVVEKVLVRERSVLERMKRETPPEGGRPAAGHGDQATALHMKDMFVIHGSQWGRLLLVVSLGVCIGLLGGVLLILLGACCYLKCGPGGGLDLGQKHSTYRSADVIDGVL
ncbi:uncharacterized protein [Panulirus ornatus]|uniref:uncharacterized protein n=1 Tax=Panulirus ornatus TaxID=150431 RepID=UPI003A83A2F6